MNREKQKKQPAALGGDAEDGGPVRLRPEGELAQHRCRGTGQAPRTSADNTAPSLPSLEPSEGRATRPVTRDPGRQERGREPGDTLRTWQAGHRASPVTHTWRWWVVLERESKAPCMWSLTRMTTTHTFKENREERMDVLCAYRFGVLGTLWKLKRICLQEWKIRFSPCGAAFLDDKMCTNPWSSVFLLHLTGDQLVVQIQSSGIFKFLYRLDVYVMPDGS